ncbi:MAG: hypothetical protein M8866_02530 [marine benthic group bacterium]|nr:hypothetical protein [Candidatus Benthicola marisminoris]
MSDHRWPAWLQGLRPDELTRRRMRDRIVAEARPLLLARRESWYDVVSEWATILSPVAAAVTLIFAGLALRQAGTVDGSEPMTAAVAVDELARPSDALPATFGQDSLPDLDVVMTVIYETEGP